MTVCTKCHTAKNHKKGGKLFGLEPKLGSMVAEAFMNAVRYDMFKKLKALAPDVEFHMTYGAQTKLTRRSLHIEKSHANDAYCMGDFRPKHRTRTRYFQKRRVNNRVLEKFYDAQYIDRRTGKKEPGSKLGCNRTNRSVPRNNPNNERIYRQRKVSKGHRNIRLKRHPIQSDMLLRYQGRCYLSNGVHGGGKTVDIVINGKTKGVSAKKVEIVRYNRKWAEYTPKEKKCSTTN